MNAWSWWSVIIALLVVIVVLAVVLFAIPAPVKAPVVATSTSPTSSTSDATTSSLASRVSVASPASGATVGKTFTVSGKAPGPWYFEASFPVRVYDADNNKIGQAIAQAQSDWMTTALVPFTAAITVTGYTGAATLVLLRDNPSGLPENDESVSIPITIQ